VNRRGTRLQRRVVGKDASYGNIRQHTRIQRDRKGGRREIRSKTKKSIKGGVRRLAPEEEKLSEGDRSIITMGWSRDLNKRGKWEN